MLDPAETSATLHGHAESHAEPVLEQWQRAIEVVTRSLAAELGASVDPARIRPEVEAEFAAYSQVRVRDFVPILVEMRVRSRLSCRAESQ